MKNFLAQIDLQDAFLVSGAISIVGGIAWIYPPAGLIAAGLLFLQSECLSCTRPAS